MFRIVLQGLLFVLIGIFSQSAGTTPPCGLFVYYGANADAGRAVGETKSAEECGKWCLDDRQCKSSEFNRHSHECYKHYRNDPTQLNKCCVRFIKVCEPDACKEKFHKFDRRYSLSYRKRYYSSTADECKRKCRTAADCHGFSYNPKTRACFMQNDPYFDIQRYRTVEYYLLVKCIHGDKLTNV